MRDCVSHHYACDCREEQFKEMEQKLAASEAGYAEFRELAKTEIAGLEHRLAKMSERTLNQARKIRESNEKLKEADANLATKDRMLGTYKGIFAQLTEAEAAMKEIESNPDCLFEIIEEYQAKWRKKCCNSVCPDCGPINGGKDIVLDEDGSY